MELWKLRHVAQRQLRRFGSVGKGSSDAPRIPLSGLTIGTDDIAIARDWLGRQSEWDDAAIVAEYEQAFAAWNGSEFARSFGGGRIALSACLDALAADPGDEVIVPGYTCIVVANSVRFHGLEPVFSDIELDTYGLDIEALRGKVTPRTRAIVLQHLYGLVCRDYEAIIDFAKSRDIRVIEDCAHSTGAKFGGRNVGNLGDMAFYSSEQSKVFNTVQGGIATTNDAELYRRISDYWRAATWPGPRRTEGLLRSLIMDDMSRRQPRGSLRSDLYWLRFGHLDAPSTSADELAGRKPDNYAVRLSAPLAAIAKNQVSKLNGINQRRRQTASRWEAWCDSHGYRRAMVIPGSEPVFLRYPVMVDGALKSDIRWAERELGIQLGVWFVSHLHPADEEVRGCPNADMAIARCINFPCLTWG